MADVWVLGSAAWDVIYEIDHVPAPGGRATARSLGHRPGGSTANVARALGSAGHRVRLVAHVGTDDLGTALLDDLASYGVRTDHVLRHGACTPETLVFVDSAGERTIVVLDKPCRVDTTVPYEALAAADAVFVGRYADFDERLPRSLAGSAALVVTPVPPSDGPAGCYATVVVGSESEYPQGWLDDPYDAVRTRVGPQLRWAVVTRGGRGADAYGPTGAVRIPAVPAVAVDTTGAGDSFTAGLIHGLLHGSDMATAGRLGAYWAAACVPLARSTPPRWSELDLGDADADWPRPLADHLRGEP